MAAPRTNKLENNRSIKILEAAEQGGYGVVSVVCVWKKSTYILPPLLFHLSKPPCCIQNLPKLIAMHLSII